MAMANEEEPVEDSRIPVSFQPQEDPTFIKRCRTTAKSSHTRVRSKLRALVENGTPSFTYQTDLQKLEEDFSTALRVNSAYIISLRHHNYPASKIQSAEEWATGLESTHRMFKEEMDAEQQRRRALDADNIVSSSFNSTVPAPSSTVPTHTFSPRMANILHRFRSPHRPPAGSRGHLPFPALDHDVASLPLCADRDAMNVSLSSLESAFSSASISAEPSLHHHQLVMPSPSIPETHPVSQQTTQPITYVPPVSSLQSRFDWAATGAVPRDAPPQTISTAGYDPAQYGYVPQSTHFQMNPSSAFQGSVRSTSSAYDLAVHCAQQYNPPHCFGSTPSSSIGTSVPISSFAAGYIPASTHTLGHPSTSSTTGIYGAGYVPVSTHTIGYPSTSSTTGIYGAGYDPAFTQGTWHHRLSTSGQPVSNVFVHSSALNPSSSFGFVQSVPASVPHHVSAAYGIQHYPSTSTFLHASSAASAAQTGCDPFVAASSAHARHSLHSSVTGAPSLSSSVQQQLRSFHQPPATSFNNPYPSFGTATSGSLNINVEVFNGDPLQFPMFMSCFKTLIHDVLPNDAMRLAALTNHLSPEVRNTISDALHDPALYNLAIARLYEEYGHDIVVSEAHVDKLLALPVIRSNDPAGLKKFSNELHGAVSALIHSKHVHELNSTGTLKLLLQKLPTGIRTKWGQTVFDIQPVIPNIADFDDWLRRIVKSQSFASSIGAMNLLPAQPASSEKKAASAAPTKKKPAMPSTINALDVDEMPEGPTKAASKDKPAPADDKKPAPSATSYRCFVCSISPPHRIELCTKFLNLTPTQRAELVVKENRCLRCIIGRHFIRKCNSRVKCEEENCGRHHHTLLHGADRVNQVSKPSSSVVQKQEEPSDSESVGALHSDFALSLTETLLQIVPVTVRAHGFLEDVLAFLDNGSTATLIAEDLADKMGLSGITKLRSFKVFDGYRSNVPSRRVNFEICSRDGKNVYSVRGGYTQPEINISQREINWPTVKKNFPHLADLDLRRLNPKDIKLLIGQNVIRAHDRLDVRYPADESDGPVAYKTPFGWCAVGPVVSAGIHPVEAQCINTINHIEPVDPDLFQSVERFWITDSYLPDAVKQPPLSPSDQRFMNIIEKTIHLRKGKFHVGFPWKEDPPIMTENKEEALSRFYSLERRFNRDPIYASRYTTQVNEYLRLGHARVTTEKELLNSPPWSSYVAHHGVIYPRKPDKLRVVFDLSSPPKKSLNSKLIKGPDFLTGLLGVLLRFRANPYSLISDIERMFHQVRLLSEEQAAVRFFWRNPGDPNPPRVHQMTVHVFGAVSSPSICAFVLRKTAQDNKDEFPDVTDIISRNFYVDNFLGSTNTEEEAILLADRLTSMLSKGGFRLTKWVSSSRKVMSSIPESEWASPTLDLAKDELPIERTLGVLYSSEDDSFFFVISLKPEASTHRTILSAISTIYDPLGMLSPVVITVKRLLQEICRLRLGWDQRLPEDLLDHWRRWCLQLDALKDLRIPRCLRRLDMNPSELTLHVCTDASSIAYGAAAYLRAVYPDGSVRLSFIMSKTRVAPLKQLSIPRLELQGAVLGLHLAEIVSTEMELELNIQDVTFWSDSMTVLRWIHSSNRFKAFVAHRVGEILTKTSKNQWRHIPGTVNPADHCSRGIPPKEMTSDHPFVTGPSFLLQDSNEWPSFSVETGPEEIDPEVARPQLHHISVAFPNVINVLMDRITWMPVSRLTLLERKVAQLHRFVFNIRSKRRGEEKRTGMFSVDELHHALLSCIRVAQETYFSSELKQLKKGEAVKKDSHLLKLSPFLDENGIVRVGGRLDRSQVAPDVKHPIVLPAAHRLTSLIIWHYHVHGQLPGSHVRAERLLSDLRSLYWIIGGRRTIQKVIGPCFTCRRLYAKAVPPLMASLPTHRLGPLTHPFVNTGLDYFGPLFVSVGRQSHKRWICIFTCMVTRSVHLETAHSLDTESFLMALQRFIDVRGSPTVIYSDNGTNLVGGRRRLEEGADRLDLAAIEKELVARRIAWRFSPPLSPHFGGVFERMVRSAKTALRAVLGNRTVNDEVLRTVISGAAALINSRPLTHVSYSPDDPEPLTPNHFLIGRLNPHLPMDKVEEKDQLSRRHFIQAQALLDSYWRRWISEYMPKLAERKKWLEKNPPLKENDFVLITDENSPRGLWPIGKIEKLLPGDDKIVRVVRVRTKNGVYTRSVHQLSLLSSPDNSIILEKRPTVQQDSIQVLPHTDGHDPVAAVPVEAERHDLNNSPTPSTKEKKKLQPIPVPASDLPKEKSRRSTIRSAVSPAPTIPPGSRRSSRIAAMTNRRSLSPIRED